jgi:conjugal transfer pilus assembly protein TraF
MALCLFRTTQHPFLSTKVVLAVVCATTLLASLYSPVSCAQAVSPHINFWDDSPWDDPNRGFNWYPDPKQDVVEPEKPPEEPPKTLYEMTTLEEIKKELERIKGVAVVNPTEANVLEFLRAQNWIMDKSSLFADVARRVVWTYPDVNYSARSPTVNYARSNVKDRVDAQRKDNVKNLAQTHAILFFARSDCDFCHDQAPVLKTFSTNTGMPVLTISMDGGPIPMFPDAKPDNGISMTATSGNGISMVPALYLIDRETQETIPLSTGVVAAEEIAERIRVLTLTTPGQEF